MADKDLKIDNKKLETLESQDNKKMEKKEVLGGDKKEESSVKDKSEGTSSANKEEEKAEDDKSEDKSSEVKKDGSENISSSVSAKKESPFLTSSISSKPENLETKKKHSSFLTSSVPTKNDLEKEAEEVEVDLEKVQEEFIEKNLKDEVLFKSKCKLYYFDKVKKKLEEKGEGNIMVNKDCNTSMIKVVMIRSSIMRHGCNHYINPRFKIDKSCAVPNSYVWATTEDTVENDTKKDSTQIFMAKFETEELGETFKDEYNKGMVHNKNILEAGK